MKKALALVPALLVACAPFETDAELAESLDAIGGMSEADLRKVMPAAIDEDSFASLLKILNDATKSNEAKATAIREITGLADIAIGLAKKLAA